MKNLTKLFFAFLIAGGLTACGGDAGTSGTDNNNGGGTTVDNGGETASNANANSALCTWDGQGIRTESGSGGKWLATLSFGEEMTLLNEVEEDEKGKKTYEKVRLLDGKEGWIRQDLIEKGGTLAAIKSDAQIYSRPSVSNITDDNIKMGALVVLKQTKEEFSEFVSKNINRKRKKGWLLGEKALTSDAKDIAAAIMLSKAESEKNPMKRAEKLKQIINGDAYAGSNFISVADAMLGEIEAASNLSEDELMITGDNVNVRSTPDVEDDNKVGQVMSGEVCQILERGEMAEIAGKTDYWYKIRCEGQEGWLFGTFTSKSM